MATSWRCKFGYDANPINLQHNLVLIQPYEIIQQEHPIYKVPVVTLLDETELIPLDSVDCIVEMKPRRLNHGQFYVFVNIRTY